MHKNTTEAGFSLIEMIVALAVFSIVITISVGALLTLITANQKLQSEQSAMTNLAFALDSMTREIRTGSYYYCDSRGARNGGIYKLFQDGMSLSSMDDETKDCMDGNPSEHKIQGIAFVEGGHSITGSADANRIVYFYDADTEKIYRRISGGSAQEITSSDISVKKAEFFVSGTDQLLNTLEASQPAVTIYLEVEDSHDNSLIPRTYNIQTTITQRALDL